MSEKSQTVNEEVGTAEVSSSTELYDTESYMPTEPEDMDFLTISEHDISEYLPQLEKRISPYHDTHNMLHMDEEYLHNETKDAEGEAESDNKDVQAGETNLSSKKTEEEIIELERQVSNLQIILMKKESETENFQQEIENLKKEKKELESSLKKQKNDLKNQMAASSAALKRTSGITQSSDTSDIEEKKLIILNEYVLSSDAKPSEEIYQKSLHQ